MKPARDGKAGTSAALMVFCVFTMSVLTVLMLGVGAYRNMTDLTREGYGERVGLAYVWTKIKNGDDAGMVYVTDFSGLPALCIDELFGDALYRTMIYHYEGRIYELFFEEGLEFAPGDGVPVIGSESLAFEVQGAGLIRVSAGYESVLISPRGGAGIARAGRAAR